MYLLRENKIVKVSVSVILLLAVCCLNAFAVDQMSFPSNSKKLLKSPDGKYAVSCEGAGEFKLQLISSKTKKKKVIYKFNRAADVLWSPDSKYLTINDLVGSNVSDVQLYKIDNGKLVDIVDLLAKSIKNKADRESIEGNDHIYYFARKWLDKNTIQIHVTGHGDRNPDGFTTLYNLNMNGTSRVVKRLNEETSPESVDKNI